jgi:aspartate kinase
MALLVMKFGGSSVCDTERIFSVASIIKSAFDEGNQVVVVVSAMGDTTDDLIEMAMSIDKRPSKREMDMLMSTGEQVSASLLAMAINKIGGRAKSLTGWQAGVVTDTTFSSAKIGGVNERRLMSELGENNIIVVTGFQGITRTDEITTLGRGGSDTSAVAIAAALRADRCIIYTDVDGIYTADPRKVKTAVLLDEISYDEMLELSTLGAQVMHNRSIELAKKYNIDLEVRSNTGEKPGTKIMEVVSVEGMIVKGVAKDENIATVSVLSIPDKPGIAFKIFSLMAQNKINVDIILQSEGRNGTQDITFTIASNNLDTAVSVLEKNMGSIGGQGLKIYEDVAKVSVVGSGMQSNYGVASRVFGALAGKRINIRMISTSEIKISVLIDKVDADKAVSAIHDEFFR